MEGTHSLAVRADGRDHNNLLTSSPTFLQVLDSAALPIAASDKHLFAYRNLLRRITLKLAVTYDLLPTALILKGVTCANGDQNSGGAFADIFIGSYEGMDVAVKRLRVYSMSSDSKKDKYKKVSTSCCVRPFVSSPNTLPDVLPRGHPVEDPHPRSYRPVSWCI